MGYGYLEMWEERITVWVEEALEKAYIRIPFICAVCGKTTLEDYMVHDEVWEKAGLSARQHAHLRCLQERLGRELDLKDFSPIAANEGIRFGCEMIGNPIEEG